MNQVSVCVPQATCDGLDVGNLIFFTGHIAVIPTNFFFTAGGGGGC